MDPVCRLEEEVIIMYSFSAKAPYVHPTDGIS